MWKPTMAAGVVTSPMVSGDISHERWTGGLEGDSGRTKDPPETSVGAAAADQVGVEERMRFEAQQRDLISFLAP